RVGHFAGFSQTDTHPAAFVAHHHQRAEIESPSALHDLGRTVDENHFLSELALLAFAEFAGFVGRSAAATAPERTRASAWTRSLLCRTRRLVCRARSLLCRTRSLL